MKEQTFKKERLDVRLVELGHAVNRTRAQAMILAKKVKVADQFIDKPGTLVRANQIITVVEPDHPYVSRGALKLKGALDFFLKSEAGNDFSFRNLTALDVGASTGGFTQILLEYGVEKVIGVDVGTNQLDWKLRAHPQVVCYEKTDIRMFSEKIAGHTEPAQYKMITADVSFISVQKILAPLKSLLATEGWLFCLIKPQFEVPPPQLGKGGILRDEAVRQTTLDRLAQAFIAEGLTVVARIDSVLRGTDGNQETFFIGKKSHGTT